MLLGCCVHIRPAAAQPCQASSSYTRVASTPSTQHHAVSSLPQDAIHGRAPSPPAMDPLSIAANVVGIATLCAKIGQGIGRFVVDVHEVPETLARFYASIENLGAALQGIEHAFRQRPKPLPFERDHHQKIHRIVDSCQTALERLDDLLPELRGDPSAYDRVRANLIVAVKRNAVQQHVSHIESYTQVLQLSLTTLSLGSLWRTQQSQNELHAAIRHLTDSMRSASLLPPPPFDAGDAGAGTGVGVGDVKTGLGIMDVSSVYIDGPPPDDHQLTFVTDPSASSFLQEIQAWKQSADHIAEVVSLCESEHMTHILATRDGPLHGSIGSTDSDPVDTREPSEPDMSDDRNCVFDPEPGLPDLPSRDVLHLSLLQNQKIVAQFVRDGIFAKAAQYQRKAIAYKQQLADVYQEPFSHANCADMREFLAEILVACETPDSIRESRGLLEGLLRDEVSRSDGPDQQRRCRLYHKLGRLYLDSGEIEQACKFTNRALAGRRACTDTPPDLVLESIDLLIKILHIKQDFDVAQGYLELRKAYLPASAQPSSPPARRGTNASITIPPLPSMPESCWEHEGRVGSQHAHTQAKAVLDADAKVETPTGGTVDEASTMFAPLSASPTTSPSVPRPASPPTPTTSSPDAAAWELSKAFAWCTDNGFDVNAPGFRCEGYNPHLRTSPLHVALQQENLSIVRPMVLHAVHLEQRDGASCTPLLVAAATRNQQTVSLLLDHGAEVNVRDRHALSPLHRCQSRSGGIKVARLLLQHCDNNGDDDDPATAPDNDVPRLIDATDDKGRTAIFMAMENGNEKMVSFLLTMGADPDIPDALGKTALYLACERGCEPMARAALAAGSCVDAAGPGLRTPLVAVIDANLQPKVKLAMIKLLLEYSADPQLADADGRTAFVATRTTSFSSEIKHLLLQHQHHRRRRLLSNDSGVSAMSDSEPSLARFVSHASRSSSYASHASRFL